MTSRNFAAWVTRCDADPAQPSSGNRSRHGVRVSSACVLRRAVGLPQLGLQRDLRDARQRLRDRAVTLHGVRDLLELRLIDAGNCPLASGVTVRPVVDITTTCTTKPMSTTATSCWKAADSKANRSRRS